MERCPSGLRCKPGTFVRGQLRRGFESPLLRFLTRMGLFYCIRGMRTPQGKALYRFERERAEAGVFLFDVMKSQKTKHGIAVTRERARQSPLLRFLTRMGLFYCIRGMRTPQGKAPCIGSSGFWQVRRVTKCTRHVLCKSSTECDLHKLYDIAHNLNISCTILLI